MRQFNIFLTIETGTEDRVRDIARKIRNTFETRTEGLVEVVVKRIRHMLVHFKKRSAWHDLRGPKDYEVVALHLLHREKLMTCNVRQMSTAPSVQWASLSTLIENHRFAYEKVHLRLAERIRNRREVRPVELEQGLIRAIFRPVGEVGAPARRVGVVHEVDPGSVSLFQRRGFGLTSSPSWPRTARIRFRKHLPSRKWSQR